MVSKIELESMYEMLAECNIGELPKLYDEESGIIWLKAIVKVQKRDCSVNYAIGVNNGRGGVSVIKDTGRNSSIYKVLEIYPTQVLEMNELPNLKNQDEYVLYLSNNGYDEDECRSLIEKGDKSDEQLESDRAEIKNRVLEICIKRVLNG